MATVVTRLRDRLAELAEITDRSPGVTRLAFGPTEREAHVRLAAWGRDAGMDVLVDGAGTTVLVAAPGEPYVLVGSHLDSVPDGGRYDGAAGVVGALEIATAIAPRMPTGVGLRVAAFSAEEGARFGRPCLGSALATGVLEPGELAGLRDGDGVTAAQAARDCGLDLDAVAPWACGPAVACFVEIHVEQGRVLESEGVTIGLADAIAGSARVRVLVGGRAEHSGTTPMRLRHDALAAAAELVLAVEGVGRGTGDGVATVGRLVVTPNATTTIAGGVEAMVDVRSTDPARQDAMLDEVLDAAADIAARRGVDVACELVSRTAPVLLSSWPRQRLAAACAARGIAHRVLPSGAGHDAALVARGAPSALVFVPSPDGLSHVPEEGCSMDDLALAVAVVGDAVLALAEDLRAAGA